MLEQSRNGRSSEWLKLRFEHNSTILIGLLLLVVAESMHVPDDVFVILFSNILAQRMSLCLLVQVAINWCSNVAQCNLYRCIEFPFCAMGKRMQGNGSTGVSPMKRPRGGIVIPDVASMGNLSAGGTEVFQRQTALKNARKKSATKSCGNCEVKQSVQFFRREEDRSIAKYCRTCQLPQCASCGHQRTEKQGPLSKKEMTRGPWYYK